MAYNGVNTLFNDSVWVNSSGTGGVRFGSNNGSSTLATGKTIKVGALGYSNGTLQLKNITFNGSDDQDFQLTGLGILQVGPGTTFNGNVNSVSAGLLLNGATFNGQFTAVRNGAVSNTGTGGNVFNGITQITNSGTGNIITSNTSPDIFNAALTLNSTNSGTIHVAYAGTGNAFNDNVYVNSTSTGGVRFGALNGTSNVATGKNIIVGGLGFSSGTLQITGVTVADVTPKSFVLGNTATLTLGPNSQFNGDVNTISGGLNLSGAVFNGKLDAVKTGATNNLGAGGNVYNDSVSLRNEGTGYLMLSNSTFDVFNSYVALNSASNGVIYIAHRGENTQFNGNIEVNSNGAGIRFSTNTGSSTLAAGKTISVGSEGFTAGNLIIGRLTQMGNTAQVFNLTGTSIATFGPEVTIEGPLSVTAGGILLNGGTFEMDATFIKNGATNENGSGGCTFNGDVYYTNNGTGNFRCSNTNSDTYNGKVTVNNTNSGVIFLAHNGVNTLFNGDLEVKSSGSGSIRIGTAAGTSILADGKVIIADSTEFTNGYLTIARMTTGTNPQDFTMGMATTINLGPAVTMNGTWNFAGGGIRLNNCYFDKAVTLIKTGTMNDDGAGNNTFMQPVSITNNNTGYFLFARTTKDVFNGDVTAFSNGNGLIYLAYNDSATLFNGNIIVNSIGGGGVRFGAGNGVAQLAAGRTVSIGVNGFSGGELNFRRFKQVGATAQNLVETSGNSVLIFNSGSIFDGAINASFPQLYLNGTTFNSPVSLEKNSAVNNASVGGNVFNGVATIINSGSSTFSMANSSADDFNAHAIFTQNGSGALYPANNTISTFAGDITVNGTAATLVMANNANGWVKLDGNTTQNINGIPTMALTIRRLEMNNTGSGLRLNIPVTVNSALTLNSGVITTTAANKLSIGTGVASVLGVSDASYVEGPVEKVGNTAFIFPTGKGGLYRSIGMTAPVATTDRFTAEYFTADPNPVYPVANREATLQTLSRCEYWTFDRTVGTANVNMELSWLDPVSCGITNINDLRVARWDIATTEWKDLGNGAVTGNTSAGTITSGVAAAPYSIFALGSSSSSNSLPVDLVSFTAVKEGNAALLKWATASEKNNDYFSIEKSKNNIDFVEVGRVNGSGNSTTRRDYKFIDDNPFNGTSYYRLRQTDFNGVFEIFRPVTLNFESALNDFKVTNVGPNPFVNELRVNAYSPADENVEVVIYNSMGHISFRKQVALNAGSNGFDLSMDGDLPPGIYFLKLSSNNKDSEPFKLIRK